MTCKAARGLIIEGRENADLSAHLAACPACRHQQGFVARVGAAVEGLPPLAAPAGFVGAVMAALPPTSQPERPVAKPLSLLLRPWELAWMAATCLLLTAIVPWLWGKAGSWYAALQDRQAGWLATGAMWLQEATASWTEPGAMSSSLVVVAAGAALAFVVGLHWLMARWSGRGMGQTWEDAHGW